MTGLSMDTAEELQVVNYGIGGHYEPHFDFARKEEKNAFKSLGTGNRIATVLFYVSLLCLLYVIYCSLLQWVLFILIDVGRSSRRRYCISTHTNHIVAQKRNGGILVQFV